MTTNELDLGGLFQSVSNVLLENQSKLDEADTYNHDHGSNMVQIFKIASQAANQKKSTTPSKQLAYVSKQVNSQMKSASAQVYSDGFARAAKQFQDKKQVQGNDMLQLVQALMGSGQNAQMNQSQGSTSDPLSALLGSLGGTQTSQQSQSASSSDPLSALLGSLGGAQSTQGSQSASSTDPLAALLGSLGGGNSSGQSTQSPRDAGGIDMGNIMAGLMAFFQSRQQGDSTPEALLDALVAGSQMSNSPARTQSGKIVANALLQAITGMGK